MKKFSPKQEAEFNQMVKELTKNLNKSPEYEISFDDEIYLMDGDEFLHFIKIAVIRNKDINNFTVKRL